MAARLARPKRAGEDFARTHHHEDDDPTGPSSNKKPRFDLRNPSALAPDAPDEDPVLDADEIGRRGQQVGRNAVNLDGYDSDSDVEAFSAKVEQKGKRSRAKHDAEDDDMFAELQQDFGEEDVDADEALRKNKKSVRFLRDDEIQGQVASSRGGGVLRADLTQGNGRESVEEDEEESESDVADEERATVTRGVDSELGAGAKKKHAPLLDAFNMSAEQEEGQFDDQGNYVRKAVDPDAVYDTWLEGVSKKDIRQAKEAADKREEERKLRDRMNNDILTGDLLKTLLIHMQRGETVLEALARLGKGVRRKPKWQTKRNKNRTSQKNQTDDVEMGEDDPKENAAREAIEAVTGAADLLMSRGETDIYDTERELLTRQYRRETDEEWHDPISEGDADETVDNSEQGPTMWEFRWSDARDGGGIHGPYDSEMMKSWTSAGYFGDGVEFRRAGDTGEWTRVADF